MESFENIQNPSNPLLISSTGADPMLSAALSNDCPLSPISGVVNNGGGSILHHNQSHLALKNFQFYDTEDDHFYRRDEQYCRNLHQKNEYFGDRCNSQIMPCSSLLSQLQQTLPPISAVANSKNYKESAQACLSLSEDNLSPLELMKPHIKQSFHSPNHPSCNQFAFCNEYNINSNYNQDDNNLDVHHFSPTSSTIYSFDNLQQSTHQVTSSTFDEDSSMLSGSINNNNLTEESNDLLAYKLHTFSNNYSNNVFMNNSSISTDPPLSATTTESTSCSSSIDLKSSNICLTENKCFQFFNSEDDSIQGSSDEKSGSEIDEGNNDDEQGYISSYNMQNLKRNSKSKLNNLPNTINKVSIKYEYDRSGNISSNNSFNNYDILAKPLNKTEYQPNVRIQITNVNHNGMPKSAFFQVKIFYNKIIILINE